MKHRWRQALYQHYTASLDSTFPQFKRGAMLFFFGLVIIYGGQQLLTPSLLQEALTLIGLIIIGTGFIMALMAQVRMLIGRILRVLRGK